MDLKSATSMILSESAPHPELLRTSRNTYDELSAGREVDHSTLSWLLREAARKDVYRPVKERYGDGAFEAMVVTLAREIDRQAPVR
jgi:hypothetical protein